MESWKHKREWNDLIWTVNESNCQHWSKELVAWKDKQEKEMKEAQIEK
jgi:hypothetical protein